MFYCVMLRILWNWITSLTVERGFRSICSPTTLRHLSGHNTFPSIFYLLPEGTMWTKLVNGHSSWVLCCYAWWEMVWVVANICHCLAIRSPDGTACIMHHYAVKWRLLIHTGVLGYAMQFIYFVFMSSEHRWDNFVLLFHSPVHHKWMDFLTISD